MHEAARGALVAATRLLEEAGVPSIAVKWIVTAYWLYEDPTERPIGDVDLRIRPEIFSGGWHECRSWTTASGSDPQMSLDHSYALIERPQLGRLSLPHHILTRASDLLFEPVETLIDPVETLVDAVETLVHAVETLVDPVKALVEPVDAGSELLPRLAELSPRRENYIREHGHLAFGARR